MRTCFNEQCHTPPNATTYGLESRLSSNTMQILYIPHDCMYRYRVNTWPRYFITKKHPYLRAKCVLGISIRLKVQCKDLKGYSRSHGLKISSGFLNSGCGTTVRLIGSYSIYCLGTNSATYFEYTSRKRTHCKTNRWKYR